jgi:hypothetical protein
MLSGTGTVNVSQLEAVFNTDLGDQQSVTNRNFVAMGGFGDES